MVLGSGSALAGGFALREQSTEGMGAAFAGVAAGSGGLGSMFWNPATITNKQGWNSSWNFTGIIPTANLTTTSGALFPALPGNSNNFAPSALLPASYTSYQLNERVWLGLQTNTPFGLTTKHAAPWAGQINGLTSRVMSVEVVPTLGYKVNEFLSVGVGVRAQYFKVGLSQSVAPNPALGAVLNGDAYSSGFSLGATLKPFHGTEIGIGYRSQTRPNLEGSLQTPVGITPIKSNIVLPDQITVGLRHKLNDRWTVMAGYEWTRWSAFNQFPVVDKLTGAIPAVLAFQYRDGWYASAGVEYQWNPGLKLRTGIGYESSPVTNATRSVRLPDNNRVWATAGLSYQYSQKLSIDLSYARIFVHPTLVNNTPGANVNFFATPVPYVGSAKAHFDIVSFGLNYRWDNPTRALAAKF